MNPILGKLSVAIIVAAFPSILAAQQSDGKYEIKGKDFQIDLTAGWVAKEWRTVKNGTTLREDMWGNPNKMLHGLQLGVSISKGLFYGLGFRSGLYYEWYLSFDKQIKDMGFNRFSEHNLYIPIHAMYRFSLPKNIGIMPFGGVGFNWAMMGKLKNGPMVITNKYGFNDITGRQYPLELFDYNNHTPHHWNVQAEVGIAVRIVKFDLSFTYSWGLNNHQLYDDVPSHQNKLAVNLSYVIPLRKSKNSPSASTQSEPNTNINN